MSEAIKEKILSALKAQRDNGLLGVVAARARISEKSLFDYSNNDGPVLSESEFADLAETLGVES